MRKEDISDEYLNSYVDNQLDHAEKISAYETISQSDHLKERVCQLRNLKDGIRQAYAQPDALGAALLRPSRYSSGYFQALAACLLLCIGAASGWFSHDWLREMPPQETATPQMQTQYDNSATTPRKVLVHLSDTQPMRFKDALDETESLLEGYQRAKQPIQIELITNKRGVDLLRLDVSAYKERIASLQQKYPNLRFMACGQTLGKLQNKGESVKLIPNTIIVSSAAEQINTRLNQGWGYVKI